MHRWDVSAPSIAGRVAAIGEKFNRRIKMWLGLELVIDPEQTLELMRTLQPYAEEWNVGKFNCRLPDRPVDWKGFREAVAELMDSLGADYYSKGSLIEIKR